MAGFFSSLFGGSLAQEAANAMPAVVAAVYKTVSGLVPAAPTSAAEVAVAAVAAKAMPALTASELAAIKTIFGEAVAQYVTANPSADLEAPAVQAAVLALAQKGIAALGLNVQMMPPSLSTQLLSSAILVFKAGMGLAAISVVPKASA
jgi:hypothetical protein